MNFKFFFPCGKSITWTEQTGVMSGECLWSDIGASAPGFSQSRGGRNPPQPPPPSSLAPGQSLQSTLHIDPHNYPTTDEREGGKAHLVSSIPRNLSASAAPRRCSHQVLEQMDEDHQSYSKTLLRKRFITMENSLTGFYLE